MERDYYLLVFESTHAAMAAQRYLNGRVPAQVVPTLRQISASCGISLRVETGDYPALLAAGDIEGARLYRVEGGNAYVTGT